jgi:glycosyltransferase involved in cell wall biosynthesis
VIGSLDPAHGGPPEVSRQLVRAYAQIGDSMEIACCDSPRAAFLQDFPCLVHAFDQNWAPRYGVSPRLWNWLHQNAFAYDGIVAQGIWNVPSLAVRQAARKANRPYCIFPHGSLDPWFKRRYPLKHVKKLTYWPIQYPVLRDAAAVFFTSDKELPLAKLSFRPNEWNAVRFPNGIFPPEGDPTAEIARLYSEMPYLRNRRFLLFLGRIQPKKGCDILLSAFARVAALAPDLDIVMAGPDQVGWRSKLQRIAAHAGISSRVHWPGALSGDLKWGALRSAEAFILPSHQENFGIAVVESLAAGRPVLITNQVNIWEGIIGDGAGMADDDTLEGIERLLRRWIAASSFEKEAMASRTYACFESRYSLRSGAEAIHAVFAGKSDAQVARAAKCSIDADLLEERQGSAAR